MTYDALSALFLTLSAFALTWRHMILNHEGRTWPPPTARTMWIIYGVIIISLPRAVYLGYRAFDPFATHHGDEWGVMLTLSWSAYQVDQLVNTLDHAKDHRMGGLIALFQRRKFEAKSLAKRHAPPPVGDPRDALGALEAVHMIAAKGAVAAQPKAFIGEVFPPAPDWRANMPVEALKPFDVA